MSAINQITIKVAGPLACFTRPEMAERISYPCMTPSAARGVLDAVLWKKEMRWIVTRITVLRDIHWLRIKRNEVGSRIGRVTPGKLPEDYFADEDRQQRMTTYLKDVAYLITAKVYLPGGFSKANPPIKYLEMLQRRVEKGQTFRAPYLGIRECLAEEISLPGPADLPPPGLADKTIDLGRMVFDVWDIGREGPDTSPKPRMFEARLVHGVLDADLECIEGPLTALNWGTEP